MSVELKTAIGKESGGVTNRWQEQFGYAYDAAGNLNRRTNNALVQTFNVNSLNELTTATNAGKLTVAGATTAAATNVTVNTSNAVRYADATFAATNLSLANGSNTFTAIGRDAAGHVATNIVSAYVPTNAFVYDLNGNLLTDGRRYFAYDDENELTSVTVSNAWRSEYVYDGKMRRRIDREYKWSSGSWILASECHYVYDGNVVLQERQGGGVPSVTYTRGNDLSGTFQGAGGIGGLLARTDFNGSAYYHADGNGNVTMLVDTNQNMAAKYLYDPYGNTLAMSGQLASANAYRFSSKEWNANAGLYYYLYRFYDPGLQRWPNRDPIQEWGGINLYGIGENDPNDFIDPDGAAPTSQPAADPCAAEKRAADRALHDQMLACGAALMCIEGGPVDLVGAALCVWSTHRFNQAVNEENACRKAHRKPPSAPHPKPPKK